MAHIEQSSLDWALGDFSGSLAADEFYDGPFCVLSIVDNRPFKRIASRVLEHDPTQDDIRECFRSFRAHLDARQLVVRGITTDGSSLYPEVIQEVFGPVPHQICQFHVIAELTKAVLHAVAKGRKTLAAQRPKLPRGRPSERTRKVARNSRRLGQKIADLLEQRYLFVPHHRSAAERKTLERITRGLGQRRTLRAIMDEVYRLFDRRCRTQTALAKLARLRRRVARFTQVGKTLQKLFSPNLEKALTCLDDRSLPATSNAVERGNRRHRQRQKTMYRTRTAHTIRARIALDMRRDTRAKRRAETTTALHEARAG